jgi:hypothetical protein
MWQAWSQHGKQVGHNHSVSPAGRRGWIAPQRQCMGSPSRTVRSWRLMAWRCPARGYQTNGRSDWKIIDSCRVIHSYLSLSRGFNTHTDKVGHRDALHRLCLPVPGWWCWFG